MNVQPFYHDAQIEGEFNHRKVVAALEAIDDVLGETIEVAGDQVLFTATSCVASEAEEVLDRLGLRLVGNVVEWEAGDPADLM